MGNTPLPPQQRAERMKILSEEVDGLQRVEEVLVAREGAERLTNCAPAAVLGVRVREAHGVRAACPKTHERCASGSRVSVAAKC
jgi:hypothetical protein